MKKIKALAFAKWYYQNWENFSNSEVSALNIEWLRNESEEVKNIFAFTFNSDDQKIKWSLIPFFLCTANGTRESIFTKIFDLFWIHPVGIIEKDVLNIFIEKENVQQQINFEPIQAPAPTNVILEEVNIQALKKSVDKLKQNNWALFKFTTNNLIDLSQSNDVWSDSNIGQELKPDDGFSLDKILKVKSAISGNPQLLQVS